MAKEPGEPKNEGNEPIDPSFNEELEKSEMTIKSAEKFLQRFNGLQAELKKGEKLRGITFDSARRPGDFWTVAMSERVPALGSARIFMQRKDLPNKIDEDFEVVLEGDLGTDKVKSARHGDWGESVPRFSDVSQFLEKLGSPTNILVEREVFVKEK